MPVNIVDGQPFDAEGNPIPYRITRIEIGEPGEKIIIENEAGIEPGDNPSEISSAFRLRSFFQKLFGGKERLG